MSFIGRIGQKTYHFTEVIGKGGEATVLRHPIFPNMAGRFYHNPTAIDLARIQGMLGNEPKPSEERGFPCFAWPMDIITDATTGHMIGTLIRYAPEAVPLSQVTNPNYRLKEISPAWLLRVARSLAFRAYTAEWQRFLIADCNPENFLVDCRGVVCSVDCDSYQFTAPGGRLFECQVGLPEYSAPEVLSAHGSVRATGYSVAWSVMVLIHMLLRSGEHPFNSGNLKPPLVTRITQGLWPDSGRFVSYPPPQGVPPFNSLHPEFQTLCRRTFDEGISRPEKRPSLCDILQSLDRMGAK